MKNLRKNIFIILILCGFYSCQQNEVDGILIGETLNENLNFTNSQKLKLLISQTLNKDKNALAKLIEFDCGGAAGCYDLGFIVTQVIYRIGEEKFFMMAEKFTDEQTNSIERLIAVGLEYGDNNKDGKMDNKKIKSEFPKLQNLLKSKPE